MRDQCNFERVAVLTVRKAVSTATHPQKARRSTVTQLSVAFLPRHLILSQINVHVHAHALRV
jgi:hypothetical protein